MNDQLRGLTKANQARNDRKYEQARDLYISYLRDHGDNADVMWTLAEVYYEIAFISTDQMPYYLEQAVRWITSAIALAPDRAELLVTLGKILTVGVEFPEYQQAAACYRKALGLNPALFSAAAGLYFLSQVQDSTVTVPEAILALEAVARVHTDNPIVFTYLSRLYNEDNRMEEAQMMVKRALLCPEPLDAAHIEQLVSPRNVDLDMDT